MTGTTDVGHETFTREEIVKTSSERAFGLVFAGFFTVVAALSIYHGGARWPWWLALAALFTVVGCLLPQLLTPLNRLWVKFGLLLAAVVSPLALAIVFYLCVLPIGLIMRLVGKDLLSLRYDRDVRTYWIRRNPPGPAPQSLNRPF